MKLIFKKKIPKLEKFELPSFQTKKEIQVVPNFIDINKYKNNYKECNRTILALPKERIITHVSNFRPVKRISDVIEIFYRIQKELPAKLMMVGEGPERKKAEQLCKTSIF